MTVHAFFRTPCFDSQGRRRKSAALGAVLPGPRRWGDTLIGTISATRSRPSCLKRLLGLRYWLVVGATVVLAATANAGVTVVAKTKTTHVLQRHVAGPGRPNLPPGFRLVKTELPRGPTFDQSVLGLILMADHPVSDPASVAKATVSPKSNRSSARPRTMVKATVLGNELPWLRQAR